MTPTFLWLQIFPPKEQPTTSPRGVTASYWQYVRVSDPKEETFASTDVTLPNGTYEVLVVDIAIDGAIVGDHSTEQSDSSGAAGVDVVDSSNHDGSSGDSSIKGLVAIEIVITAGPEKGRVCTVEFPAAVTEPEALEALGLPGVLLVDDGQPHLQLEQPEPPRKQTTSRSLKNHSVKSQP